MEHQALYRKWRPLTFEEMVGQTQVTSTLRNQIKAGQLSHAYMFSGIRGTGKTSVARLFARAVNCLDLLPTGDPCNQCEACLAILSDQCMDVIEMDAASNNGVDDIRDIREHVKFPPSHVKYKVYIIDEVHMLSKGAFNALLKTLEEPPQHVLFLLATTELHKVPQTILSRCQRYDFKRIPPALMADRLAYICSEEGYPIDDAAIQLIVKYAEGALRDAQSLLNQCMSFSPLGLNYDSAIDALGKAKDIAFESLFQAVVEQNVALLLDTVEALIEEGKDLNLFLEDTIDHLREALLHHMRDESVEITGSLSAIPLPYLMHMIEHLAKLGQDIKWSSAPRVLFEVAWIKLIKPELTLTLEGLDQRIKVLEQGGTTGVHQRATTQEKESSPSRVDIGKIQIETPQIVSQKSEPLPVISPVVLQEGTLDFKQVQQFWPQLLEAVRVELKTTHALLKETDLVKLEGNEVHVAFPADLAVLSGGLEKEENKRLIEAKLMAVYQLPLKLKVVLPTEDNEKKSKGDQLLDYFEGFEDKIKLK